MQFAGPLCVLLALLALSSAITPIPTHALAWAFGFMIGGLLLGYLSWRLQMHVFLLLWAKGNY